MQQWFIFEIIKAEHGFSMANDGGNVISGVNVEVINFQKFTFSFSPVISKALWGIEIF